MNKWACSTTIVLIVVLLSVQLHLSVPSDSKLPSDISENSVSIGRGVNYLSLYHMYSRQFTSDDILNRDFSRFQRDGLNVISLSLYWFRLEGNTRGDYDGLYADGSPYGDRFLEDVKRVINVASEHGLKVLVTFHTLWGEDDSPWCTPDYVVDPVTGKNIGLAIVRSEEMRQAFVDMFNHTVEYLAKTPGIWTWAILNEPWYWPHELASPYSNIDQKENFIDLIQTLSRIVRETDGRPVTIKFCNSNAMVSCDGNPKLKNVFVDDWNWDRRILDSLDFIGLNVYVPANPQLLSDWCVITTDNVIGSSQRRKNVWITEFGFGSNDDYVQYKYIAGMIELFNALPLDGYIAFFWRGDDASIRYEKYTESTSGSLNLCNSCNGVPRSAYLLVSNRVRDSTQVLDRS